jgi:hypothetical protein
MKITPARAVGVLLALTLVVGGGNLWASWDEVHASQAAQQRAGQVVEEKLCSTLGKLAVLKPPAGSPQANPSRAYEQELHATLAELGPDIGCDHGGNL